VHAALNNSDGVYFCKKYLIDYKGSSLEVQSTSNIIKTKLPRPSNDNYRQKKEQPRSVVAATLPELV
jgi:hypothetical protein